MEIACVDTSVLIDHYRAADKSKTFLFSLVKTHTLQVPSIVRYEVLRGDRLKDRFWLAYFANKTILLFDNACAETAAFIYASLRMTNQLIGAEDILIAAIALSHDLPLVTMNAKHFSRINQLKIITSTKSTS